MDGLKVKVEFKDIEDAYLKIRKSIRNKKKLYLFEQYTIIIGMKIYKKI